mmetsp:Transcript_124932/g.249453  ORF Transcript_124932/g.249453 Transcript_124932/m.249453 type:complete len:220 (-) Transcript_124932:160-819(-)
MPVWPPFWLTAGSSSISRTTGASIGTCAGASSNSSSTFLLPRTRRLPRCDGTDFAMHCGLTATTAEASPRGSTSSIFSVLKLLQSVPTCCADSVAALLGTASSIVASFSMAPRNTSSRAPPVAEMISGTMVAVAINESICSPCRGCTSEGSLLRCQRGPGPLNSAFWLPPQPRGGGIGSCGSSREARASSPVMRPRCSQFTPCRLSLGEHTAAGGYFHT